MEERTPKFFLKKLRTIWHEVGRRIELIAATEGLTGLQMFILISIGNGDIENIGGLCREFSMGHPNASIMCKKMEADGFVSRERSSDDERYVVLTLTEKGKITAKRLQNLMDEAQASLQKKYPEEIEKISEGLSAMETILEENT